MKYDRTKVKAWCGNSHWRALRADFARFRSQGYSGWGSEGFWVLTVYRSQRALKSARPAWLWAPVSAILLVLAKILSVVTHIGIDENAQIGPGLLIPHSGPIRIHGSSKIGADCCLSHVCTIGAGPNPGGAIIGDHVWIGCHSSIIGAVTIGDGATIASNSLVINNVPAGATAIGVPARIITGTGNVAPSG